MAFAVLPYTFTPGSPARASEVNANFLAITTVLNGGIEAVNLATDSVTSAKILAGAVSEPKLAAGAVTDPKVAPGIDAAKIGDGTVTNTQFAYLAALTGAIASEEHVADAVDDMKDYVDTELANLMGLSGYVPTGAILMWSGSVASIPLGYLLCDGQNGTPDLRDRFVVGAGGTYEVGATGGANTVVLATTNLPEHSHGPGTLSTSSAGGHSHSGTTGIAGAHTHSFEDARPAGQHAQAWTSGTTRSAGVTFEPKTTSSDGAHTHSFTTNAVVSHTHSVSSGATASVGSGTPHENRPPYFALCYIMKS